MKEKLPAKVGQREVRSISTTARPLTVRTSADGSKQVSGYAIVFNSPSADMGFTEICSPTMLDRTLNEKPDVLAFRDHKQELLIGRTTAGTLTLKKDKTGLAFTITLPNTAIGLDTAENVRLRNLTGCSFGFTTREDDWTLVDDKLVRTLLDVDLYEISITSFPAYEATSVNTRSCPPALRARLNRADDDDQGDPSTEEECRCECASCVDGDCSNCTDRDCDDELCSECPIQQDQQRSDKLRIRQLFASRMSA